MILLLHFRLVDIFQDAMMSFQASFIPPRTKSTGKLMANSFMCTEEIMDSPMVLSRLFKANLQGLRQGFLALDILKLLDASIASPEAQKLVEWYRKKKQTKHFLAKVQFTASCQRTGRRSEIGQVRILFIPSAVHLPGSLKIHLQWLWKPRYHQFWRNG